MVLRLVRLLQTRAVAVEPLLAEAGLSLAALQPSGARVPYAAADQLLELAAAKLGASGLGLELAQTGRDEGYGASGFLLVTGWTFRQGLARALGYPRLGGEGERSTLLGGGRECAVEFRRAGAGVWAGAVA